MSFVFKSLIIVENHLQLSLLEALAYYTPSSVSVMTLSSMSATWFLFTKSYILFHERA